MRIEAHGALAAVHRHELRAGLGTEFVEPPHVARAVADGRLHLHHLRTEVREVLAGGRPLDRRRELEHADAVEDCRHGSLPLQFAQPPSITWIAPVV
jgi:hypothetical protein